VLHRAARGLGLDFGVADTAYVATLSAFVLATMLCRSAGMTAWSPIPGESRALAVSMVLLGFTAIWTASRVVQASR
jgi:hypothetical protein